MNNAVSNGNILRSRWMNRVYAAANAGALGDTGVRVAEFVAEWISWDRVNNLGAPLLVKHRVLLEDAPFSKQTLYTGRGQLIEAGLLVVELAEWHAVVGDQGV